DRGAFQFARRNKLMNHANFICTFGINWMPSEQNLFGKSWAYDFDQLLSQRERNDQAEASEGHAKASSFGRYAQVTMQRQLTASSQGVSLYHRYRGVA